MALGDDVREGAVLFGLCVKFAMKHGPSLARAGFGGGLLEAGDALFTAMLERPYGVVFAKDEWSDVLTRIGTPDKKIALHLPDFLDVLATLPTAANDLLDPAFPFVLSAGDRRSFTANTIIRDPAWRKKDAGGALRIHPDDAAALAVATGDLVRLTTKRGAATVMWRSRTRCDAGTCRCRMGSDWVTRRKTDRRRPAARRTSSRARWIGIRSSERRGTSTWLRGWSGPEPTAATRARRRRHAAFRRFLISLSTDFASPIRTTRKPRRSTP